MQIDSNTTIDLVNHYATYSALSILTINVFLSILFWKKLNIPFRRLFYFLVWNSIIEILAFAFIQYGYNNLPLLHIYTLGEFILFGYFYKSIINKPIWFQKSFWYFIIIGSLFIILNSIFFQSIFGFNTYAKTFGQVTIIIFAVLYFYNLIENKSFSETTSKSLRLVNSAILIYYSGSLFIFMYGKISFTETQTYTMFWAFNSGLYFIFQLLILLGLWKAFYKKRTSSL